MGREIWVDKENKEKMVGNKVNNGEHGGKKGKSKRNKGKMVRNSGELGE